jgi:hypothetical protein
MTDLLAQVNPRHSPALRRYIVPHSKAQVTQEESFSLEIPFLTHPNGGTVALKLRRPSGRTLVMYAGLASITRTALAAFGYTSSVEVTAGIYVLCLLAALFAGGAVKKVKGEQYARMISGSIGAASLILSVLVHGDPTVGPMIATGLALGLTASGEVLFKRLNGQTQP